IAAVLRQARSLSGWFSQCENSSTSLTDYFDSLIINKFLENKITDSILSEDEIADTASDALASIRKKIRQSSVKIRESLDKMIRSSAHQKHLQDAIVTMRDGRFVVPVKAEYRSEIAGLVHDTSASGATLFIEPVSVVEANNEIRLLQSKEKEEIERILAELSADCAAVSSAILCDYQTILELNLYFAKANLAADMHAFKPEIFDDGIISLKKARHPLIDRDHVVPIDVELGERFTGLIVTGPNTGGKTVTLKTLGLLTLMAMCGLMIPAESGSRLSVFQQVLVDIGDEQSIEQSLSTFSSHMTNIISILKKADQHSLVLLDELGSGTDPVEGAALAISIIEELSRKGSRLAATTHYAELKMYALQTEGIENACCEFDVATLRPTYRLLIGVPGRSNAFAISARLGLDHSILEHAKGLVSTENKRFEDVVENLEHARQEYEEQTRLLYHRNQEVEQLRQEVDTLKKELEKQKSQEMERARLEAKKIVDNVRLRSEQLMDELEELRRQKNKEDFNARTQAARSQLKGRLGKLYDQANPVAEKPSEAPYRLPRPLKVGDSVLIADIDKKGVVLALPDKGGNVMVQAGIIKSRVPLSNLRLLEEQSVHVQRGATTRSVTSQKDRKVSTEIDLRGQNVEEALINLDHYIDNCVMGGMTQICIIHGKGTGVLRTAVQNHLKHHKNIASFRLGTFGEGENGVTIAEIK
ncbi:MAG TPA: endonuclease MutS2, partial [Firmicutes bacterium]|nr:endonuclease MutS2 [Bacillota bacterium]